MSLPKMTTGVNSSRGNGLGHTIEAGDGFRRKPVWDWVAREEHGLDPLALIWGWLTARRRQQAHAATGIVSTCFLEVAKQLNAPEPAELDLRPEAAD